MLFMTMRVRILKIPPMAGIDGIRLDCFDVGHEYELGNSLAALFLAEGWAEPVPLDAPKPVEPFSDNDPFDSRLLYRDRHNAPPSATRALPPPLGERDIAADMYHFRRRRRPR